MDFRFDRQSQRGGGTAERNVGPLGGRLVPFVECRRLVAETDGQPLLFLANLPQHLPAADGRSQPRFPAELGVQFRSRADILAYIAGLLRKYSFAPATTAENVVASSRASQA